MVFCLILLGKDKNQTNFECNYVCPSSQIKCGHQAPDEISLRVHKAQCSKIRKKGKFFWDILQTIYYHPKILKLTCSTEEICTFKNDFTKTIFADFTFLFDFVIYLFCTIFLILEQCARQPMGIIFFEMAKYLSLIMYVKIVNKFLKPKWYFVDVDGHLDECCPELYFPKKWILFWLSQ